MKAKFLLPNSCRWVGWMLFIPPAVFFLISIFTSVKIDFLDNVKMFVAVFSDFLSQTTYFTVEKVDLTGAVMGIMSIVGLMMVAFSKEKEEDEFILKIRLESLVWAIYVNNAFLILCFLLVYGLPFLWVMIFNLYATLLVAVVRFKYVVYKSRKQALYEK